MSSDGEPTPLTRLTVVSGPSGAGKGTIIRAVMADKPALCLAISATTRPKREGEVAGQDYHFMAEETFQAKANQGAFLEACHVHGYWYGTLASDVDRAQKEGRHVLIEIDVQGAKKIKDKRPEARLIFIAPPSVSVLEDRLRQRGTETGEMIQRRLAQAHVELAQISMYDDVIINNDLNTAIHDFFQSVDGGEGAFRP